MTTIRFGSVIPLQFDAAASPELRLQLASFKALQMEQSGVAENADPIYIPHSIVDTLEKTGDKVAARETTDANNRDFDFFIITNDSKGQQFNQVYQALETGKDIVDIYADILKPYLDEEKPDAITFPNAGIMEF